MLIVTRHAGAVAWIRNAIGRADAPVASHLDGVRFKPGDKVYGVLPLAWAANVCAAGAQAFVLTYDVPLCLRGRELDESELCALGARLVRYDVRVVDDLPNKE